MDRRHFLLGITMGLGAGGVALSETETITETVTDGTTASVVWETKTYWDNYASQSGVVHEDVTNTDHTDASILKMGYPIETPQYPASLAGYYPLHEDSGTTAYDFSGNDNDGSVDGATVNEPGLFDTTAYIFNGSNDRVALPDIGLFESDTASVSVWFKTQSNGTNKTMYGEGSTVDSTPLAHMWVNSSDQLAFDYRDDGGALVQLSGPSVVDGNWHLGTTVKDGASDLRLYLDGAEVSSSTTTTGTATMNTSNLGVLKRTNTVNWWSGQLASTRLWRRALTPTEVSDLHAWATTEGSLETMTKQFDAEVEPDLGPLDYTLNGETILVDVIGSPGDTAEETHTVTLTGDTSYTLTWANPHQQFRVRPRIQTPVTTTPTVNSIALST